MDLAKADIISAEGQVEQANAQYNNTIITAPLDGTVTSIDIKVGELASALKEVIILQDISNIYIEANINEANISNLNIGMPVDITYDAFGSDKIFKGNVTKIDPSSTLVSGVVNYKITANVEQSENLRPGMTANMTIKVKEKNYVITVPSRSVLVDIDGNKTIRVVTNTKTKKFKEVPVVTGLEGDGGVVEITNGLKDGDEFVVLIKTK
jgi:HlyD family secretion protein